MPTTKGCGARRVAWATKHLFSTHPFPLWQEGLVWMARSCPVKGVQGCDLQLTRSSELWRKGRPFLTCTEAPKELEAVCTAQHIQGIPAPQGCGGTCHGLSSQ